MILSNFTYAFANDNTHVHENCTHEHEEEFSYESNEETASARATITTEENITDNTVANENSVGASTDKKVNYDFMQNTASRYVIDGKIIYPKEPLQKTRSMSDVCSYNCSHTCTSPDFYTSSIHIDPYGHEDRMGCTYSCAHGYCSSYTLMGYYLDYDPCCDCGNHVGSGTNPNCTICNPPSCSNHNYVNNGSPSSTHNNVNGGHAQPQVCSVCGATRTVYVEKDPCCACGNHNSAGTLHQYPEHPHENFYDCFDCGIEVNLGGTNTNTNCCDCGYHSYSSSMDFDADHPHQGYYECTRSGCNAKNYISGMYGSFTNCETCYPEQCSHSFGVWSSVSSTHTSQGHAKTRTCSSCGEKEYDYENHYDNCTSCTHTFSGSWTVSTVHTTGSGHEVYRYCSIGACYIKQTNGYDELSSCTTCFPTVSVSIQHVETVIPQNILVEGLRNTDESYQNTAFDYSSSLRPHSDWPAVDYDNSVGGSNNTRDRMLRQSKYTITVQNGSAPVSNASVNITTSLGSQCHIHKASNTTNSQGKLTFYLEYYGTENFTVTVSSAGVTETYTHSSHYGEFANNFVFTSYYSVVRSDYASDAEFRDDIKTEGCGYDDLAENPTWYGYSDSTVGIVEIDGPQTRSGDSLVEGRSIAVDGSFLTRGAYYSGSSSNKAWHYAEVYIPALDLLPDDNGVRYAQDSGKAVCGYHIDIYMGFKDDHESTAIFDQIFDEITYHLEEKYDSNNNPVLASHYFDSVELIGTRRGKFN